MKKKEILKDYTNKLKQFKKYNKAYFEDDDPIISDAKYDKLKNELINLEKNYKFIKNPTPASFSVGYKPSKKFKKVDHLVPMLSLANAFSFSLPQITRKLASICVDSSEKFFTG